MEILDKYYYFNKSKISILKKQDIVHTKIVTKSVILKMKKITKNIANNIQIITSSTLIINQKL